MFENTPEQIARHYSACLDSVALINRLKAKAVLTEDEVDTIARNKSHLATMRAKDYWTTEDMTPLEAV